MKDLIEGGFVGQILLILLVWVPVGVLSIQHEPIPEPLIDAGLVIIGFYFHVIMQGAMNRYIDKNPQQM